MTIIWKLLRTDFGNDRIPQLLTQHEFGKSNYTVFVTDLTNIWTESLEQRPLIERAWAIDSPIDPVDSEQREKLLSHIQDALDGKKNIEIQLSAADSPQRLHLTAHIPLPKPLKPLIWPFHLMLMPQSTLTNEFLLPCIGQQVNATHEVASLLHCLRDKDFVISKLLEKMQAEGIDLAKVFPSAAPLKSGRKPSSREDIGRSVQGLGQFNEENWRAQFAKSYEIANDKNSILAQAFASSDHISLSSIRGISDFDSWWLYAESNSSQKNERKLNSKLSISPPSSPSTPIDNGFQVRVLHKALLFQSLTINA